MNPKNFFAELKRRSVYKVAVAYAAVGWLVIQIATSIFPPLQIPAWTMRLVIVLVLLGFPLALVLAWAFEDTPEGVRRTHAGDYPRPRSSKWGGWIALVAVAFAGAAWLFLGQPLPSTWRGRWLSTSAKQEGEAGKSIAVLPFASLSEDKGNAYFAEGIQDEILTRLAKIGDLKVISRTSTLRYKSAPENLPEIAKQLGVAHILEGSVQKSGERVRINVQLINAQTDTHLWAETYDRTLTDVFAVESEVAQRVADSLRATLTGVEKATLASQANGKRRGLRCLSPRTRRRGQQSGEHRGIHQRGGFLRGRGASRSRSSPWHGRALPSRTAACIGPDTTARRPARRKRSWRRKKLANCSPTSAKRSWRAATTNIWWRGITTRRGPHSRKALSRLPNNADALVALSFIERRKGRWSEAVAHQEQAARLDPQSVPVLTQLGVTYFALKRFAEARAIVDRLLGLAPENPQVLAGLARLDLAEGNLEAAETAIRSVPPAPSTDYIFEIQVRLALIAGRHADAIRLIENAFAQTPAPAGFFAGKYRYDLGFAKELAGDAAGARAAYETARGELAKVLEAQPASADAHLYLAFALAGLGEKDAAYSAAQSAIALRPSVDAVVGASFDEAFARVKARFGENDAVIADLRRLLATNYLGPEQIALTPALLRLDPAWISLRSDPRFQDLSTAKQP